MSKISKNKHITTTYRCFKIFHENLFLTYLVCDLEHFEVNRKAVNEDLWELLSIMIQCLDKHATVKQKRVKSARLPSWYTPEIGESRKTRDHYKHLKQWPEYKKYRNKTRSLIKKAKRKHFTDAVENCKDTRVIWKHFRKAKGVYLQPIACPMNSKLMGSTDLIASRSL